MAQGVCSAHVTSLHLTLSILMFHPPSLPFPARPLRHLVPVCTFLAELFPIRKRGSGALPHERWREFGHLADPTHSTGCEPKESDKITSADGDTMLIDDPDLDEISDFSKKHTHENTRLFGVSTMLEASVSHVSHGDCALQIEDKESMHRETDC